MPKKTLINSQRPIVWSAADVFEKESYISVIVTEIDKIRGTYLLAPAPEDNNNEDNNNVAAQSLVTKSTKEIFQTAPLCNLDLHTLYPFNNINNTNN